MISFVLKDLQKERSRGTLEVWAAPAARVAAQARQSLMSTEPMEVLGTLKEGPVCRYGLVVVVEVQKGIKREQKGHLGQISQLGLARLKT